MDTATSVGGIPIRLTDERWQHIASRHPELAEHRADVLQALRDPDVLFQAPERALGAVRKLTRDQHIVVLYREVSQQDGFVITSWLTSRPERLLKREVLWNRPS